MSKPLVVCGIDLGTYATGFAWAVIDEENDDAERRRIHFFTQWPGQPVAAVKNLSALLLGEEGKVLAWGYEARRQALSLLHGDQGLQYRASFKMDLMKSSRPASRNGRAAYHSGVACAGKPEVEEAESAGPSGPKDHGSPDAGPDEDDEDEDDESEDDAVQLFPRLAEPPSEAERLTIELLSRVREAALAQITSSGYLEEDVRWGITVPAIFNDALRQSVRRCAAAAGFSTEDGRLILALEPEAAVHHARVRGARTPDEEDLLSTDLAAPGRRILVADNGGGTVDLAAYVNDEAGRMVEVGLVNGGRYGSNELNRRFEDQLLVDRFGKPELVAQLREEVPEAMLDLVEAWERQKVSFGPDTTAPIPLPIPSVIDRKLGAAVRKRLARKQRGTTHAILITPEEMQDIFDTVVPDVLDLIDEQLAEMASADSAPDAPKPVVLMVGGFSNSPYLQHAFKEHLKGRAHVLVPPDPSSAVLYGAVHFAYSPQTRARRARFTYGVNCVSRFEPGIDPENLRKVSSEGVAYCRNRFSKLVTVGDTVDTDREISDLFWPIEGHHTSLTFDLYTTTHKESRYVTDPGCEQIGRVVVNLKGVMRHDLDQRGVRVHLRFGETEIKVRAVVEKTGEEVATTVHFATDY
ncbi:Hsp70 family protein [Streptomyces sp. NPDC002055]|uniref:Hsp70 family protein n=1 Tax=Streptomyces sp. NPDC002055 TaxID=3154534 RepID=UPI00331FB7A9